MKAVFLSASVPDPSRDPRFFDSANPQAIREAVRTLAGVVLPMGRLVFGGHPAISPFVRQIADARGPSERVRIYQSRFFEDKIPEASRQLHDIVWTPTIDGDRDRSLAEMRRRMIEDEAPVAGVFIGGMEGVIDEYELFVDWRTTARPGTTPQAIPVASTGAAARLIHERASRPRLDQAMEERLDWDLSYRLIFRDLLQEALGHDTSRTK